MTVLDVIKFNDIQRQMLYLHTPRPIAEYHEDMGPVLWWWWKETRETRGGEMCIDGRWAGEPPYVGSPNNLGRSIGVLVTGTREGAPWGKTLSVGGWPGYHTHFTPIPNVIRP